MNKKTILLSIIGCMVSAYTTMNFAASAAPLYPIKPQLLQQVTIDPRANQDTHWLTVDNQGNKVLIALSSGQTPAIDLSGNANFKYVSNYLHKQNLTLHELPAGLYFWQTGPTKGHLSSAPTGPLWVSTQTGYRRLTNQGALWDPNRKHDTHPFKLSDIPNMIVKPQAKPKQQLQKEISSFSIASINILNERPYARFSQNKGMPIAQRQSLFNAAFNDPQQLQGKDIIAFQEIEPNSNPKLPQRIKDSSVSGGDLAIYYDQDKFIKDKALFVPFTKTPGATNRGFLVLNVHTNDAHPSNIMIINTHLEGGPGGALGYHGFRESQLREIKDHITKNNSNNTHIIICGDFNTDSTNPGSYQVIQRVLTEYEDFIENPNDRVTAYNKKSEAIDYLLYSSNLTKKTHAIYPPKQVIGKKLLQHDASDIGGTYFSDHAIISAQFSFASNAGASSGPSASAASASSSSGPSVSDDSDEAVARELDRKLNLQKYHK